MCFLRSIPCPAHPAPRRTSSPCLPQCFGDIQQTPSHARENCPQGPLAAIRRPTALRRPQEQGTNAWRLEASPDLDHQNPRQETRLSFLLQHSSRRCQVSLLDPTTASPSQPTSNFFSVQALDSTRPGRFCDCTSCPNPPSPAASLSTFVILRSLAQLTASTSDFLCLSRPGPKLHQRQTRQPSLRQHLCPSLYLFSADPSVGP